jgi:hypothetical protein
MEHLLRILEYHEYSILALDLRQNCFSRQYLLIVLAYLSTLSNILQTFQAFIALRQSGECSSNFCVPDARGIFVETPGRTRLHFIVLTIELKLDVVRTSLSSLGAFFPGKCIFLSPFLR